MSPDPMGYPRQFQKLSKVFLVVMFDGRKAFSISTTDTRTTPIIPTATAMETQAKALITQLSKCESDVSKAAQELEKNIKFINEKRRQSGRGDIPDPIKLIKRITALEIALSTLQQQCTIISNQRSEIVFKVLSSQCDTVSQVNKMLDMTHDNDPYSSREDIIDESWETMTRTLQEQTALVQVAHDGSRIAK